MENAGRAMERKRRGCVIGMSDELAIREDRAPVRALTDADLSRILAGIVAAKETAETTMAEVRALVGMNPTGIADELLRNMSRSVGGLEHCRALLARGWRAKNAVEKSTLASKPL